MPSVDNRVVEMRFDNKNFETNVDESISTLDKLKAALKLKDATEGFDEIDRAAESINHKFSALGTITDQIFRNIGNEIYNLKNQFVGLVKSLSTDQITEGWDKYAEKTSAVQTIMAATASQITDEGERMSYVNEQLDRLNWFADETSASLMDMTNNIGKFTNNGVKLDDAVTSMQGIANWGYLSGANINEMSRAMYNLSQALSVGSVTLIDWKSIENANMATVEFKQTALDTAVAVGTLTKVSDGLYKTLEGNEVTLSSFNQYLTKDRWFNKEVLMQTLDKYGAFTNDLAAEMDKIDEAGGNLTTSKFLEYINNYVDGTLNLNEATKRTGLSADELISDLERLSSAEYTLGRKAFAAAQEAKTFTEAINATKDTVSSKWMQTFEIIFGDYQQAKGLWTKLSNELWDIFAAGGDARNDMLKEWASSESGGYKVFWDSVWNIWEGLKGLGGRIKAAWKAIFPELDSQKLIDFTERLYDFSVRFRDRFAEIEETVENVSNTISGSIKQVKNGFRDFLGDRAPGEAINEIEELNTVTDEHILRMAKTISSMDTLIALINSGKYSVGEERRKRLEEEGYDYELIQNAMNEAAGSSFRYVISEEDLITATKIANGELVITAKNTEKVAKSTHDATSETIEARTWIDDLRDVLGGLRSALDLIIEGGKLAAKYLITPAWNFLVNTFKKVLAVIAPFSKAFTDFVNRLKESKAITKTIEIIAEWFRMLKENLKGQENVQKFVGYLGDLKEKLDGFKESALERVTEFFDKIVHLDENLKLPKVEVIGDWIDGVVGYVNAGIESLKEFSSIWPKIKSFFEGLDFSSAKNFGKSAGEGLSEFFKGLFKDVDLIEIGKNIFTGILKGIFDVMKSIEWGTLLNAAFKGSLLVSLTSIGYSISKFFLGLSKISSGSLGILESLGTILQNLGLTLKSTAILGIATAIGILVASLVVLSLIPTNKLHDVTAVMLLLFGALALLVKILTSGSRTANFGSVIKNIISFSAIVVSLGYFLGKLGIALIEIAAVITLLSFIKTNKLVVSIIAITSILGVLFVFTLGLSALPLANIGKLLVFTTGLVILGAALSLLIPSVLAFSALSVGSLLKSVITISSLLVIFSLMSKLVDKVGSLIALAIGFIAFAAAIALITPALIALITAINHSNWYDILIAVGAITILLYAFTGVIAILTAISAKSGKIVSGIGTMIALAIGIASIGSVLKSLQGAKFKDLIGTVGAILVFMTGLTAIATIIGVIIPKVPLISEGFKWLSIILLALSGAFALTAISVLAFAKAFEILSKTSVDAKKAGKNLAEGVIAFFDELVANGRSILQFIEMVVLSVIAILVLYKSNIVSTGASIISAFGDKIVELISSSKGKFLFAIAVLIAVLLAFLGANVEPIASIILGIIGKLINGVARGILEAGGYVFQAIINLANAIASVFMSALNSAFGEEMERSLFGKTLKEFGAEIDDWLVGHGLPKFEDSIFGKIGNWWNKNNAVVQAANDLVSLGEDTSDLVNSIDEVDQGLSTVVDKNIERIQKYGESSLTAYSQAGENIASGFSEFKNKILTASKSIDINGEIIEGKQLYHLKKGLMDGEITAENYGSYISETLYNSFERGINNTKSFSFADIFGQILNFNSGTNENGTNWLGDLGSQIYDGTYNLGVFADTGLADGMNDELWQAMAAAKGVSVDTLKEMYDAAESNSPSKVTMRLGNYLIDGLVIGMKDKLEVLIHTSQMIIETITKSINSSSDEQWAKLTAALRIKLSTSFKTAAEEMTDEVLSAFNSVVARISDAIDGNFDMSPVIRPVLDLSEIQNGSARIGSILGTGANYTFNPNLAYGMMSANNVVAATGQMNLNSGALEDSVMAMRLGMVQLSNDNKTIINVLSRYLPYIPEFANMEVTLDKKVLVGQLTPAINNKLGDIALKKR